MEYNSIREHTKYEHTATITGPGKSQEPKQWVIPTLPYMHNYSL